MLFEDIRNGARTNLVSNVVDRTFDPLITPAHVFTSHPQNQLDSLWFRTQSARLLFVVRNAVASYQLSMPTTDRVRLKKSRVLIQIFS